MVSGMNRRHTSVVETEKATLGHIERQTALRAPMTNAVQICLKERTVRERKDMSATLDVISE